MNEQLQNLARIELKSGLSKCTAAEQLLFKRMYSPKNIDLPIDQVVDNMPADRLDWAMQQVQNTLLKFGRV